MGKGKKINQFENPDYQMRRVENPYLTDAMRVNGSGQREIDAVVNMRTLLGGFCRFHGSQSQNAAAARFKAACEAAEIGGARATDTEKEPVDGGGVNPEFVFIAGQDARKTIAEAYKLLGGVDFNRFSFIVIHDNGPTAYARWREGGRPDGRTVAKYQVEGRKIANRLAELWNLAGAGPASGRMSGWDDGSEQVYDGVISTRRRA